MATINNMLGSISGLLGQAQSQVGAAAQMTAWTYQPISQTYIGSIAVSLPITRQFMRINDKVEMTEREIFWEPLDELRYLVAKWLER